MSILYVLIFNAMSKISMICPYMSTASNYIYVPAATSVRRFFYWWLSLVPKMLLRPPFTMDFGTQLKFQGIFLGGMPDGPMIGPQKNGTVPLTYGPMGKPMGNSKRLDRGVKKEVRTFTNLVQNLGFPPAVTL